MKLSKNKKIVLITGSSLRHIYIQNILIKSKKLTVPLIIQEKQKKDSKSSYLSKLQKSHFKLRNHYENFFFKKFTSVKLKKNQTISIKQGLLNKDKRIFKIIEKIKPDIVLTFGCSILGEKYLKRFNNKILNIHLGLSPYYRGQATNFWAFVNDELQFIGATFHKIDKGIDTGPIIHQMRGRIYKYDNVHSIGNRVIKDLKKNLIKILLNFENLRSFKKKYIKEKYFKSSDFNDQSIIKMYRNYKEKIIIKYLKQKKNLFKKYPIIEYKNI
tara:strand:- start:427 stop:1239 length:813 start_codon:yes stop_codon:yes gene_type:complete